MASDEPKPLALAAPIAAAAHAAATPAFFLAAGIVAAATVPFAFTISVPEVLAIVAITFPAVPIFLTFVVIAFLKVFLAVFIPKHMATIAAQAVPD